MFYSEKKLRKKIEEDKKRQNMTMEEKQEQNLKDNIKNGILLLVLLASFAIVIHMTKQMRVEIDDYDKSEHVIKDMSSTFNDIKPLYPDEKVSNEKNDVVIEDEMLYQFVADEVYNDLDKHIKNYERVYKNFNREDINYIKVKYVNSSGTQYYYITNEAAYKSNFNIYLDQNNITTLELLGTDIDLVFNIIEQDIPVDIEDYLTYLIELGYFKSNGNLEFEVEGRVFLNDGSEHYLSLEHFVTLASTLENIKQENINE